MGEIWKILSFLHVMTFRVHFQLQLLKQYRFSLTYAKAASRSLQSPDGLVAMKRHSLQVK